MAMQLTIQHKHVRSTDGLDSLVENQLLALQDRLEITEARVWLEHRRELRPAFHARVHIVTPGLALVVEAADHTMKAAIHKLVAAWESRLQWRARQRAGRRRSERQKPAHPRTGLARRPRNTTGA